jgi:hypothetical protein
MRSSLLKARTALILWAAVAVAGALPVLCFAAAFGWQLVELFETRKWVPMPATLLLPESLLPSHPAGLWIVSKLHAGLVPALLGLGIAALGVIGVRHRRAMIRAQRQQHEDRLRRVDDYRRDGGDFLDGRREPCIADRRAA